MQLFPDDGTPTSREFIVVNEILIFPDPEEAADNAVHNCPTGDPHSRGFER